MLQQNQKCPNCDFQENLEHNECQKCGHDLSQTSSSPRRGTNWLQMLLLLLVVGVLLYPQIKKRVPGLGDFFEPGQSYETKADEAFKHSKCAKAVPLYQKAIDFKQTGFFSMSKRRKGLLYLKMASCYEHLRKPKQVLKYSKVAQKLVPKVPWSYLLIGDTYRRQRRSSEAIAIYKLGIKENPKNLILLNNLARLLATSTNKKLRNLKQALALSNRAMKQAKGNKVAFLDTRAEIYFQMGKVKKAIKLEKEAIALSQKWKNKRLVQHTQRQLVRFQQYSILKKALSRRSTTRPSSHPVTRPTSLPLKKNQGKEKTNVQSTTQKDLLPQLPPQRKAIIHPRIRPHKRSQKLLTPPSE